MFAMTGRRASDGYFEEDVATGEEWWMFPQPGDLVFWQPQTGEYATWYGNAFALNQLLIHSASTYAFDGALDIFVDPIEWLRHERCGIVIVKWHGAWEMLRDCPRIRVSEAIAEPLIAALESKGPQIFVRPSKPEGRR